jgi:DNA-binding Lrp family transcriptional regulator
MEISRKDARLLFELDQDSRQSNLSLARKLHVSKNTVKASIERLRQAGIIRGFYTVVDVGKLGYRGVRTYVKLRNCPRGTRDRIARYFSESELTWWVGTIEKEFDIGVVFWARGIFEFETFWNEFRERFHQYVAKTCISIYTGFYDCTYGFLAPENERRVNHLGDYSKTEMTKNELAVLGEISDDARARTVTIAKKLALSPLTVKECIKRLKKKGVIRGFRVMVDLQLLGYAIYKVSFNFSRIETRRKMLERMLLCPNLIYIDETLEFADLEGGLVFKTHGEFREFLEGLLHEFSRDVVDYSYFIYLKVHKIKHL